MRERHSEMPAKQTAKKAQSPRVFGQRRNIRKCFALASTPAFPHSTNTPSPCRSAPCANMFARRGWTIAMQVKEVGSGAAQRELREKLLDAARRREIDVVLVWRLDRWGRSVADLLATLQELDHLGVGFVSLTEALDLTTPAGRAMAALLAVFAEFEREILRERVRAGLAHARQNGQRLGRPVTAGLQADKARKLHRAGVSKSEIARRLNIGRTSVRRILA
jgi:putative DNA-invertase from lambdoid prophage Rac